MLEKKTFSLLVQYALFFLYFPMSLYFSFLPSCRHFHVDHCAGLPYFTERLTGFRGRIFATHATIAVMRLMLQDTVRVSTITADNAHNLYDTTDVENCINRIEPINLHQKVNIDGVQFLLLNAGHVLGAAMVLMEIAGVRILYTGDYSCEEDRHLMAAEIPKNFPPNVLIVESTFGMQIHESREHRERRFTQAIERILKRGGRVLIPVLALGRAQELLLILEEYWAANPHLQKIPIYNASGRIATKSLEVYRTYISAMNERVQRQATERNPWNFQYITTISPSEFKDTEPCVVMATPGMLHSGFSRQLFDKWCEDPKNGIILSGLATEGTLARELEMNPVEVESLSNRKLIRRCEIERISFVAHADSMQTAAFVDALRPGAIVLVHGERTTMKRLHTTLSRKYETSVGFRGVYMPRNNETVKFRFQEEKIIRLVGSLAENGIKPGTHISGILVNHDFETLLLAPSEVSRFTQLATHTIAQKLHIPYRSSFALLKAFVTSMYSDTVEEINVQNSVGTNVSSLSSSTVLTALSQPSPQHQLIVSNLVTITHAPPDRVIVSWTASPISDMIADSLVAVIAQAEVSIASVKATSKSCNHSHGGENNSIMDAETGTFTEELPTLSAVPMVTEAVPVNRGIDDDQIPNITVNDMVKSVDWADKVNWATDILNSDSGPFVRKELDEVVEKREKELQTKAHAPAEKKVKLGAHVIKTEKDTSVSTVALLSSVKRRKELLLRILRDQYGDEYVIDNGSVSNSSSSLGLDSNSTGVNGSSGPLSLTTGVSQSFHLTVKVDDKRGEILYDPAVGFRVEAQEGRDEKVRLGAALERATDMVNTMFKPIHHF